MKRILSLTIVVVTLHTISFHAAAPVHYTLTFPEPEHRWMQVDVSFADLGAMPLELRMSRSSPGRYSLHEFAKNVYDVHAFARDGHELQTTRPDAYGWNVGGHGGAVSVKYKIYGDRLDGVVRVLQGTEHRAPLRGIDPADRRGRRCAGGRAVRVRARAENQNGQDRSGPS